MSDRSVARVEFFKDANDQWRFRRVGANDEKMAQSEGYQNFVDAQDTADEIFKPVPWFKQNEDGSWEQIQR